MDIRWFSPMLNRYIGECILFIIHGGSVLFVCDQRIVMASGNTLQPIHCPCMHAMNDTNRLVITYELVEFERGPLEVQDFQENS